ncbi:MAG: efflux RND transporter periplasmic adaptor subunit [Acidobacteria bacterium]|nr:efflux RND transporter periplasmic adaptor subunit [Acidobacteriota bacterium]
MSRKVLWASVAIVTIAGAGAALGPFVPWGAGAGDTGVAMHEVRQGRFTRRAAAEGFLKAVTATPIAVPVRDTPNGLKILWIADDGARVHAGEPVLQFDPTELERTVLDSRDDQTSSEKSADKARVEADASRLNLADEARVASREEDHARTFASEDESIFSRNDIIESRIDMDLAAQKAGRAGWKIGRTGERSNIEIGIHEIKRAAAEQELKRARAALAALTVTAPHDGLLTLERNWRGETVRVGDSVWPGQKIGELPELGAMEAKVWVLEADAAGLEVGRAAEVVVAARPDTVIPAKVSRVDAVAKSIRQGVPVQYFETILSLSPPPGVALKPGLRVRATILLEDVADVITVPRQAIFERDGKPVVYRSAPSGLEPVAIAVGRYGLGSALVTSGIAPGDRIALRDPERGPEELLSGSKGGSR